MTESEDPRADFLDLLRSSSTIVWYSEGGGERLILTYLLRLFGTSLDDVRVTSQGFVLLPDASVALVRLRGPRGGAVTVTPLSEAGVHRINDALSVEWDEMRGALSTGTYVGNEASASQGWLAGLDVHPDWEGSPVLDYVAGSSIIHATGIGTSPPLSL